MIHLSKILQDSIDNAFFNPRLRMEDIVPIMMLTRKEFQIDKIILYSNREYKYQLSHVLTCSKDGVQVLNPITCTVTREEYEERVKLYRENLFVNTSFSCFEQMMGGYPLNTGLMRDGEYFGTLLFWSEKEREWKEEEKYVLQKLAHLCLIFFGMNNLSHGTNHYRQALQEIENENVVAGFFVNMMTRKTQVIKMPDSVKAVFPEWEDYDKLLDIYAQNYVEGFYKKQIFEKSGFATIKKELTKNNPIVSTEFPRIYNGKLDWVRFMVRGDHFQEDGTPTMAIGTIVDITEDVKNNAYLFGASNATIRNYKTIIALELNSEQYAVCVDERRKKSLAVSFDFYGNISLLKDSLFSKISEKEQRELDNYFDITYLQNHFDNSDDYLMCDFPVENDDKVSWIRLNIIKSSDYSFDNRKVMLYFTDITDVKSKQLLLEEDNQKKNYQLEHDALTGTYNRKGYDDILKMYKTMHKPVVYMQLDIDNFKNLNDNYGHNYGDEVLKEVAKQLKDVSRETDYVFRFGGDEFAVLLTDCQMDDIWSRISQKQELIHVQLNQVLKKDIYVTLSIGISWSNDGFHDELIYQADAALYQAKSNGKAGCCVFDSNHKTVYEWRDALGNNTNDNLLDQSDTGACRIELNQEDLLQSRLVCNDTARVLLGFDTSMTPKECFQSWLSRVDSSSRNTIAKTKMAMIEKGQAECTYIYRHPIHGRIMVRSGGRCLHDGDGLVFYGYHQSLQDTRIVLQEDDSRKLIEAMMSLYFASYYIDLTNDKFYRFKSTEESSILEKQDISATVTIQAFVNTLVKPEYREKMSKFVDLSTIADRMHDHPFIETEYESMVADKGWCRIRFFAVKYDENGKATHIQMLIASIDKEKKKQLEEEKAIKNALELQLSVGEMIAKTKIDSIGLVDRKTGLTNMYLEGIVSKDALVVTFEQMKEWGLEHTLPIDVPIFGFKFNMQYIEKEIQRNGSVSMPYRSIGKNNEPVTMIHHFKVYENDSSKLVFAVETVTDSSPRGIGRIEEFAVLDQLIEAVAVFDYETYEIVYVNKAARDIFGMDISQFQKKKCYEVFTGKNKPCEFCDKVILDQGKHGFMYRTIEATGEKNFLHGCVIEVAGRKYRLEQAISQETLWRIESELIENLE